MKTNRVRFVTILIILAALAACTPAAPTAPPETPTVPPTSPPTAIVSPTAAVCQGLAVAQVTVYARPSTAAEVFGIIQNGAQFNLRARTADGWYGFDPGVAQAANTGLFRYRWAQEGVGLELQGDCAALPPVVGPAPGVCYFMPLDDVPVYAEPDSGSEQLAVLAVEDYAAVLARGDAWSQIDLAQSNLELANVGWVDSAQLNLNGPCEDLPAPAP